jgi:two-component system, LytTR family, response regulator
LSTLKVAIVDDEPLALQRLRRLVAAEPDLQIVAEGHDGMQAVELIHAHDPDVVFLDVQMPELDGFGVLEIVGPQEMPPVVFVTAYDEYAVRAFEANAVDYLLKPFDQARFRAAVQKARRYVADGASANVAKLTENVRRDRVVIRSDGRYVMLRSKDIEFVEAAGNYMVVHTTAKSHTVRETLSSLEGRLDSERFVRIHRSSLVNIDFVQEMQPTFHGEYVLTLKSGHRVNLSRSYRDKIKKILDA